MPSQAIPLSLTRVFAAATAMVAAGLMIGELTPSANAASAPAIASAAHASLHDGVDWSRVAATPVDTGATIGAYDR